MTIDEIIQILENRIAMLTAARESAMHGDDLNQVQTLDKDIIETTDSLHRLRGA